MICGRGDSATEEQGGNERTGIPGAGGKTSRDARPSGKPSKELTESSSLNKSDTERERGSTSPD